MSPASRVESTLNPVNVDFDEMKFVALRRFLDKLEANESASGAEVDIDDLQYDFLERCDAVLLRTVSRFMENDCIELHLGEEWEDRIGDCFESVEEDVPLKELLEECLHCLEAMEDIAASWMSVVLFEASRLQRVYEEIVKLKAHQGQYHASEDLREEVMNLVMCSPILDQEDYLGFRLRVEHLNDEGLIWLLNRFLQIHLTYGCELQEQCLTNYPELGKKVRARLMREATIQAKRLL